MAANYREITTAKRESIDTDAASFVAELSDGTQLLRLGDGKGVVDLPDNLGVKVFEKWNDARLFYGLWLRTGGFTTGESPTRNIPIEVVREGKDAVAAYLLVGSGVKNSRGYVAKQLEISEQTVSNYANRVRWSDNG